MPALDKHFETTGLRIDELNVFAEPKDEKELKKIQKAQSLLKKFVDKEFSSENFNFLSELHELYKNQKNGKKVDEKILDKIYQKYVIYNPKDDENTQVNLKGDVREQLKAAKEKGPLTLEDFAGAVKEILGLVQSDTIPRFLKDPEVVSQLKNDAALKQDDVIKNPEVQKAPPLKDEAQKPSMLKSFADEIYKMLIDSLEKIKSSIEGLAKRAMDYFQDKEPKKDLDDLVGKGPKGELSIKPVEKEMVKKPSLEPRVPPPYTPLSQMARDRLIAAKNQQLKKEVSREEIRTISPKIRYKSFIGEGFRFSFRYGSRDLS